MAFSEENFENALFHKGYKTNADFLEAYNRQCEKMSEPTFYNKKLGRSDWTRTEISNIVKLLKLTQREKDRIFFCN